MALITWNPLDKSSTIILSNNNLTVNTGTTLGRIVRATEGKNTGKWYFEFTLGSSITGFLGIGTTDISTSIDTRTHANLRALNPFSGNKSIITKVGGTAYTAPLVAGDKIGILLNLDDGILEYTVNGISRGVAFANLYTLGAVFPIIVNSSSSAARLVGTANFGATEFQYPLPEGYLPYDVENATWFIEKKYLVKIGDTIYSINENKILVPNTLAVTADYLKQYGSTSLEYCQNDISLIEYEMDEVTITENGRILSQQININDFEINSMEVK